MELNSYFRGLLSAIEPSGESVATAKRSHEVLRSTLQADEEMSEAQPDSYLSGSYARDTAINDIKDVDIVLLLDLDHTTTAPAVAVAWLQMIVSKHYEIVRPQGRSVQVTTDEGFDLDVVPSVAMSNRDGPVWIPDRDAGQWVATHPKGQIAFSVSRNQSTQGLYKHLVKVLKHWRDRLSPAGARVKSYILESLVAEAITTTPASHAVGVVRTFEAIETAYSAFVAAGIVPTISDPGYPGVNVAKRWQFDDFALFMDRVTGSRRTAAEALAEEDKSRSLVLWQRLFGDSFDTGN